MGLYSRTMSPKTKTGRHRSNTFPVQKNSKAERIAKAMAGLTRVQMKDLCLKGRKPAAVSMRNHVRTLDLIIDVAVESEAENNRNLNDGCDEEYAWLSYNTWADLAKGCEVIKRCLAEEKANYVPKIAPKDVKYLQAAKDFMPVWLRFMREYVESPNPYFYATTLMIRRKFA